MIPKTKSLETIKRSTVNRTGSNFYQVSSLNKKHPTGMRKRLIGAILKGGTLVPSIQNPRVLLDLVDSAFGSRDHSCC